MIPNQWYAILESREVKRGRLVGFTRMGEKMVAWRDSNGEVAVLSDLCPHRGAALSAGRLADDCVQCPFHGFEFDSSGACRFIPANGKNAQPPKAMRVKSYVAREAHGVIYIWWGEPREEYPPLPWFENIEGMVYSTICSHWKNHYARAIENQLDVVHLPFVHYNTIGSGGRTLVNGPVAREVETAPGSYRLDLWVDNESDYGQKPRKPSEMPVPARRPLIQFHFPNLWQNWLSDDFLVFLVFAPIDEENTMMYLRQYHRVKLPILRQVFEFLAGLGNLYILNQDKRVVVTQRPPRPDLDIGETLIPGDYPIALYRKRRRTLIAGKES
ncbi:MAG: aromatic ring-hydroxylating dioxygenase subunit alpha [Chloroflexi bacterium]|nr:aromatic ring-hydroxylating dioxygenase subunit alpha [Chloroflexota bacterium]MCA2002757.1 aromatic ring-hydroxylating dioxygenase subunit alpha [Chloroflexota bacterium]